MMKIEAAKSVSSPNICSRKWASPHRTLAKADEKELVLALVHIQPMCFLDDLSLHAVLRLYCDRVHQIRLPCVIIIYFLSHGFIKNSYQQIPKCTCKYLY